MALISAVDARTESGGGDCDGSFLSPLASTRSNESLLRETERGGRKGATDRERKSSLLIAPFRNVESGWTKTSLIWAEGVFVSGFSRMRV